MLDISTGPSPRFSLGEDQLAVREMARNFAAEVFAPHALAWDEAKHFPVAEMRRAAALGMGGVYVSAEVGGSGLSRLDATLIFEALATGCPTVSAYMSIHNMAAWMIDAFGSEACRSFIVLWQPANWRWRFCARQIESPSSGEGSVDFRSKLTPRMVETDTYGSTDRYRMRAGLEAWARESPN